MNERRGQQWRSGSARRAQQHVDANPVVLALSCGVALSDSHSSAATRSSTVAMQVCLILQHCLPGLSARSLIASAFLTHTLGSALCGLRRPFSSHPRAPHHHRPVLLLLPGHERQRAGLSRVDPSARRTARQVLCQRLRARPRLQLPQSQTRTNRCKRDDGGVEGECCCRGGSGSGESRTTVLVHWSPLLSAHARTHVFISSLICCSSRLSCYYCCCYSRTFPCAQIYSILDEIYLGGEIQETSKRVILERLEELNKLE